MADGRNDIFAQYVYQAQIQAAKAQCKCVTCQLLRKASDLMAAQLLSTKVAPQSKALEEQLVSEALAPDTINLEEVI